MCRKILSLLARLTAETVDDAHSPLFQRRCRGPNTGLDVGMEPVSLVVQS